MKTWVVAVLTVFACLAFAASARADPVRILVSVSHTRGIPGEVPLHHSGEDADHVRDVMTALGGVTPATTIRIADPTLAELTAAIDRAGAIAAQHAAPDVSFVLYFSGHGDRERIHLGGETLAVNDLLERVRHIPASLRLLVTDACRNDPTRDKGIVAEPAFALAGHAASADGVVWLSASQNGEAAQESDDLHGAIFTHYWVSGLRGAADANGDGRVTLAESYDFAYSQTLLRSARGSGVLQHPQATYAVAEYAPIVLTETFASTTRLQFPSGADTHYLVYAMGSRAILGELWSSPERAILLAVPPGRYIVERRASSGTSAAAELALARGQTFALSASDFRDLPEERLASKGGEVIVHPRELTLELGAGTSRLTDGFGSVSLRYAQVFDAWALQVGPRASYGVQQTSASNVDVETVGLEATLEKRFRLGAPVLALGAGGTAELLWQHVTRSDAAVVALAGYPTSAGYSAFAAGGVLFARLRVPIGVRAWIEPGLRGELLGTNVDGSPGVLWSAGVTLGVGWKF